MYSREQQRRRAFFLNQPERAECGEFGIVTEALASSSCGLHICENLKHCPDSIED